VGTVHLRKLIGPLKTGKLDKALIEQIMVEPYFIPEGTPLTTQLLNFRSARRRRGLVVDEYGDILGLVTLEEILEEIVGDFTTETLAAPDLAQPQQDGSFLIPGSAAIRDLNRQLHWQLPLGDSRTLNGLITEYLEDLPVPGTSLLVGDYLVEVVQTRGPVIQVARLRQRLPVTENTDKHSDTEES